MLTHEEKEANNTKIGEDMQAECQTTTGWNYGDLAERVVFGEEAADGLAVDLARGEVDETLVVLGAVLDLGSDENEAPHSVDRNLRKR